MCTIKRMAWYAKVNSKAKMILKKYTQKKSTLFSLITECQSSSAKGKIAKYFIYIDFETCLHFCTNKHMKRKKNETKLNEQPVDQFEA